MARRVLTSPAKGKTTRNQWSRAFQLRHPDDFYVGLRVHWHRGADVMTGFVTKVTYDKHRPAYVRCNGRTYKPHADDYCNKKGGQLLSHGESLYDTLSKNRRAANARDKPRVSANVRKLMRSKSPWLAAAYGTEAPLLGAFHEAAPIPPGVFAVGAILGPHEYAGVGNHGRPPGARQWLTKVADYEVRQGRRGTNGEWGIYTRDYNVRLATFAPNSACLREALRRMFDIAHLAAEADARDPYREMAAVAGRMAAGGKGWYTHDCGQWVHDKLAPCSVCKPKRKKGKRK